MESNVPSKSILKFTQEMRVITSTALIWGPNLLSRSIQRRAEAVPWLGQLDYSANPLGLTSAFHWTSARCSSFRFRVAWRSPRGKGAAACCHHGPREEAAGVHYVSATHLESLHPYFSPPVHNCNNTPKENMIKPGSVFRKSTGPQLNWSTANAGKTRCRLRPTWDWLKPQVLIFFFNEAEIKPESAQKRTLGCLVRESTERDLLPARPRQLLFLQRSPVNKG